MNEQVLEHSSKEQTRQVMLTTIDNPFNYFTQFDEWLDYDEVEKHYNSLSYLARIARTSNSFTDEENHVLIEAAIDEIVEENPGFYIKQVYYTNK